MLYEVITVSPSEYNGHKVLLVTTSNVPSEDWCIIGNSVPRAMTKNSTLFSFFFASRRPNFSRKTGANSILV